MPNTATKNGLLWVAVVLLPFLLVSCDTAPAEHTAQAGCNELTCDSYVEVGFAAPIVAGGYSIDVCLDDFCETADVTTYGQNRVQFPSGRHVTLADTRFVLYLGEGSPVVSTPNVTAATALHHLSVSLKTADQDNQILTSSVDFHFEILQPNGPACAPVCRIAVVRLPEFQHPLSDN